MSGGSSWQSLSSTWQSAPTTRVPYPASRRRWNSLYRSRRRLALPCRALTKPVRSYLINPLEQSPNGGVPKAVPTSWYQKPVSHPQVKLAPSRRKSQCGQYVVPNVTGSCLENKGALMLKIRCETCTRLIVDIPVTEGDHQFCVDACRESWKRATRRFRCEESKLLIP
jgi:hypothetical protein